MTTKYYDSKHTAQKESVFAVLIPKLYKKKKVVKELKTSFSSVYINYTRI